MKTIFYKIVHKGEDVVYIGVTLRPITERFKEHLISKRLDKNYSVVELYCIEHPEFTSLEVFLEERGKVAELEQKFIKEEREKGSHLLNISAGGEWGCHILEKLHKEEFYKKFGSYDNYKEYKRKTNKFRTWLMTWVLCRTRNRTKVWVSHWVECRKKTKVEKWMRQWVKHRCRKDHLTREWVSNWINNRSQKIVKKWLRNWIHNKSQNVTKRWLRNWVSNKKTIKL